MITCGERGQVTGEPRTLQAQESEHYSQPTLKIATKGSWSRNPTFQSVSEAHEISEWKQHIDSWKSTTKGQRKNLA